MIDSGMPGSYSAESYCTRNSFLSSCSHTFLRASTPWLVSMVQQSMFSLA